MSTRFEKLGIKTIVTASGRTDSGVHAAGQIVHFDAESSIPTDKFPLAVNAYLPDDVSDTLRLVRIGDYDVCPCAGLHVSHTRQIGRFVLLGTNWDEEKHSFRIRFKLEAPAENA